MILAPNESPKNSLFYIGACLIRSMSSERFAVIDSIAFFEKIKSEQVPDLSLSRYLYALNWLYIIGLIDLSPSGDIKRCF